MNNENEILTLLFGLGTLIFVVSNFTRLRRLRHASLFLTGYALLLPGWAATLFDQSLPWADLVNAIEHVAYASGIMILTLWTILIVYPSEERKS